VRRLHPDGGLDAEAPEVEPVRHPRDGVSRERRRDTATRENRQERVEPDGRDPAEADDEEPGFR
jgi:hypothetical protein